jgi:hypothetical protein
VQDLAAAAGSYYLALIQRYARALLPGGHLVIREFILQEDRTALLHAAIFECGA